MYKIRELNKSYGNLCVLEDLNLDIKDNIITCILGPSGCGKTTLFNIMSGVLKPDSGSIDGFEDKTISYLFQEPRLLKWKTVKENIRFVLEDKMSEEEINSTIDRCLDVVGLKEYESYYPNKLSGGMKQRTAIARAFAYPANILLMDEPFKSLDLELRMNLITDFQKLHAIDNKTVIFITHDIHAALMLGDEIVVLSEKPTNIKKIIINNVPKYERGLNNERSLIIQKNLINIIKGF